MRSDDLVLGIDGGGTKTAAWLAPRVGGQGSPIFGRGSSGPANFQAVGADAAIDNLNVAVDAAFEESGIAPESVAAAVLALAGSDRDENRQQVERWAMERRLARRFRVVNDALPVLAAGSPEGWGVALICGTGSLCFGQSRDGRSARAGGWGYLFGDEGSAYAMAVAGLRAAAKAADLRGPPTRLLQALLNRLGLRKPEELVLSVYAMAAEPAAVASLAEEVTRAAAEEDAVAEKIIDGAADDLAAMVGTVAKKLNLSSLAFPLAVAGSVLLGAEGLQSRLVARLRALKLDPAPLTGVEEPVIGAVKMAQAEVAR
jgi:N-acetylglucosamine kinase-like BadF-type ATPase